MKRVIQTKMRVECKEKGYSNRSEDSDRFLLRSILLIMVLMLFLVQIPDVMTASSNIRMTLDTKQISPGDITQGYSLTLHLINSLDDIPVNDVVSLNNSLDGTDFSSLYELVVIRDINTENGIESSSYKYFGALLFPITYDIVEQGNYIFRLSRLSDGSIISESSFRYPPSDELFNSSSPQNNTIDIPSYNESQETSNNLSVILPYNVSTSPPNCTTNASTSILLNCSDVNITQNKSDDKSTNISLTVLDKCSNVYTELDKQAYSIGEPVQITFSNIFGKNVNTELTISTGSSNYKFVGDLSNAAFVPTEIGNYTIYLTCDDVIVFNKTFSVDVSSTNADVNASGESYVPSSIDKGSLTWKQITIRGSKGESISKDVKVYNKVRLDNIKTDDKLLKEDMNLGILSVNDSSLNPNSTLNSDSNLSDTSDNMNTSTNTTLNTSINMTLSIAELVDIDLSGIGGAIDSNLKLNDLVMDENADLNLYVEDVPKTSIEFMGNIITSYAMDLSNLNFTNGTFTKTAVGKELWKCASWDFMNQHCNGSWIKLMDIVPGTPYDLQVSAIDPGYIETGVATVNTLKSLYYPNDDVDIVMVILDTQGYLVSDAEVILTIIGPDNTTTITTTNDFITSNHKGIYEVGFTGTSLEGVYTLIVQATGENVNSKMFSQFTVSSNHTFEILRSTPVTIDPHNGPFTSDITLISNIPISTFDYTEVLPKDFNVTDSGDGIISQDSQHTYITWYGLTNDSMITYSAQTPLEVPNVYDIGPGFITYEYETSNDTFYESRPWFLAIDPIFTGTFFMFWDGASNAPAGWTCVSCNPGDPFYGRFIMGSSTYGSTGGNATHNHTVNYVSETTGATVTGASSGGSNGPVRASGTHAHSDITTATIAPASNYPVFRQLKVIAYSGKVPSIIPEGAIGIFNTSSLPANWTQYSVQNNYFIFGNATANTTGGNATHNHTLSITISASTGTVQSRNAGSPFNVAAAAHTHTGSGTTVSGTNLPPYIDVVLARANASVLVPYGQGFIGMFNSSIGDGWINMSQSGQTFNNKILRAAATYSATGGGSNISNHTNRVITTVGPSANGTTSSGSGRTYATGTHYHNVTVSLTNASILPPYINVVFGYANHSVMYPPVMNRTECYRQGTGWVVNCTTLTYNSILTGVRTNCYSDNIGGNITNVSFTLRNMDQNITYFNTTVTSMTGAYWQYNLVDSLSITDSGVFNLTVVCRETSESSQNISWTVPWGNITVRLINPNSSMNVTQNRFFNFTVNISCVGGQCGDASIVLDPTTSWWDTRWMYRRLINVTNNNIQTLKQNYSIKFILNTTGNNFTANGSDVRVVYYNGSTWIEIDRINETAFNSSTTEIWFKLQSSITANSYNDNYYVYYGNRFAGTPPTNKSKVYLWFDDFNRANKADITTESAYGSSGNGGWAISGNRLLHTGGTADPTKLRVLALGTPLDDVDMKMKINVTNWAGGSDNYRFGLSQDMDDVGGAGRGYNGLLRNALTQSAFLNDMVSWGTTTAGTSSVTLNNWYYMRYQSVNNTNPGARLKIWAVNATELPNWNLTGNYGTNNRGKGYVGIMGALVATVQVYIDDLQIRYVLPNEPNATLGVQEYGGKGDVPMYAGTPFYTITDNPMMPINDSCLSNMSSGKSCNIKWTVNATGNVNTTWNFFAYAYSLNFSSYARAGSSSYVNITILGNVPPIVRSAALFPIEPVYYENINCTLNVTDQNIGDTLSATINWYRNGVFILSDGLSITDGQYYTSVLDSSYLSIGDLWSCGVVPYDGIEYGTEVYSNNVSILASVPPRINSIECLRNGAVWVSCSNIIYGNTLSKVRANCTSRLSYPASVSFNLTNKDDSYTFFTGSTADNSTGYWLFDNSDFVVSDSGVFNLSAICIDINGTAGSNHTNWTVPWGKLSVSLISPNTTSNVTSNKFFNFTSRVTCTGGECGYVNATIDPVNWWNTSWNYRRTVNLTERANKNLTDYQFGINISTQSLITAGKMNANCSDIRFTTNNTPSKVLDYWIESGCNTTSTIIWVKYNLSALAFNSIYLYYGNPTAINMSNPKNTMFLYEDMTVMPDGSIIGDAAYIDNNTGVRMTIADNNLLGYIYYAANPGPGFYGKYETWAGLGPGNGADSTWIGVYDTSVSSTREDIVYGGYHFTVDEWQDRIAFTKSTVDNGASIAEWGSTTLDDDVWHTYETYFYNNGTRANALIYYDGVLRVNGTDNTPQSMNGQYFLFGARTGGSINEHRIRGIQVRKYVRPIPLVEVQGEVTQFKGVIPMYNGTPFYTITANPMLPSNNSCLSNMKSGDSCNTTWEINATGMLFIPWEFFVTYSSLNYSGRVITNITAKVNITIIGNQAPVVSAINLVPTAPLPIEDLNCTFTVTDTNLPDILTANVTWYKNNAYYSSSIMSVSNGISTVDTLGSGNLTLGDVWKCGVRPYDQQAYGLQVNSSNRTVVNSKPPFINKLECYINNSVWTNCTKLGFYANLTAVRINCTTAYKPISNVSFNLSNTPDNKLFFNTVVTSNIGDYWTYNLATNLTINDSGEFILNAVCTNNESASDFKTDNWTVPWGRIAVTLVNPNSDGYVEYNKFFNFTAQIQCVGGECGNVTATLDPEQTGDSSDVSNGMDRIDDKLLANMHNIHTQVRDYKPIGVIIESSGYDRDIVDRYVSYQSGELSLQSSQVSKFVESMQSVPHERSVKYSGNTAHPYGLLTVNTNKEVYRIGESATISVVSLDVMGDFSSGDAIDLILISPSGERIDLNGLLSEIRPGLYLVKTGTLKVAGDYKIIVSLNKSLVGQTIVSSNHFSVKDRLDYEIIRESPLAINPWDGNEGIFETRLSFKILDPELKSGKITFTEILPPGIELVEAINATVWKKLSDSEYSTYITWNDISPSTKLYYTVKPMKLSPEEFELKSFILVNGKMLDERRSWRIAVDPVNYYTAYNGAYAATTTSGSATSGGSYAQTTAQDCSGGTCTQSNSYVTGITGFTGGGGATCTMNVTLLFNISDIKTIYLNDLSLAWGGCWHGDSNLANPRCDGVNTPKFTAGTGGGVFDMWVNMSGTFVKLDCIDNFNNECGAGNEINLGTSDAPPSWGDANSYHNFRFEKPSINSSYVNNGIVAIRWRTWAVAACGSGGGTNIFMALDSANLSVNWSYLIKSGVISMVPGTEPFYTTTANPHYPANNSCLASMISGKACNITWQVNATGGINTSHIFYVIGDASTYNSTVMQNISRNITLTIRDTSRVPPSVTLNAPTNNYATQNTNILFNCSATDNSGLVNMTLYADFSGTFMENVTNTISGISNTTTFNTTLSEGRYLWNCMATDTDTNTRFATTNRTLTIDYTDPSINLSYPEHNDNLSTRTVTFNFTIIDNLDSSMVCNLTLDSVDEHQNFAAGNGSIISKTVANLSQGDHYWNVTCVDDAGNINTSETKMFTVLSTPPVVILQTVDNYMTNQSTVELYYFTDDGGYITQADLYINDVLNYTEYVVVTGDTNSFTVLNLSEGKYNWTVNVTNNAGLTSKATSRNFYIDFTAPTLNVSFPENYYNTTSSTVMFNFTAIDMMDSMMACKITINGIDVLTGINANNNSLTSRSVSGIKNGLNYWNITCVDDAGNFNISDTRVMNVSALPTVALNTPANNTFQKLVNITLSYTPSGNNNMSNCSLILNGVVNQTNSTISLGAQNNFKLVNLVEGGYTWSVNCTDTTGYVGSSITRIFYIDTTVPTIVLKKPIGGETVYGSTTTFNYSVTDNLDPSVTCSLFIDGNLNRSNIVSYTNNDTLVTAAIAEGIHTWRIDCLDHALNTNSSITETFTVIGAPTVTPVYPEPYAHLNYSNDINFTYIPSSGNTLINATLYINGIVNQTVNNPSNGVENSFYLNFTNNGKYNWSVLIVDSMNITGVSASRVFYIDTQAPFVGIITPINGQNISVNNVSLRFNVTDNIINPIICNVTLMGPSVLEEWQNISVTNGSTVTRNKILYDGNYNWSVTCADNATNLVYYLINFTVFAPPNVTLNSPIPNYRTKLQNITFNYTPRDDIGLDICTLVINDVDVENFTSVVRNVPNYFNIPSMAEGDYNWTVRCTDSAPDSNVYAPAVRNFTIDLTPPTITPIYPGIDDSINSNTVQFNWTASDYPVNLTCIMFVDDVYNRTITQLSGTYFTPTLNNFTSGVHNWTLNCSDDLNNSLFSPTRNFTINNADLYLDSNRIYFNNTNPDENQTISISANITNIGGVPATGVFVEFYDGNPGAGGIYIGNATANVNVNASVIFSTSWNITTGYHVVYISVDPYDVISELSELNNNATKNISLLRAIISNPLNGSMFMNPNISVTFNLEDYTGGLINYSVYVDNVLNGQTGTVTDAVPDVVFVMVTQGTHSIKIEALDALGRRKNSTAVFVIVDYTAPNSTILTADNTWYNNSAPIINITSRDNIDTNINYSIYVNGSINAIGNITNGSTTLVNLSIPIEGYYELIMEAYDDFNNIANSTPKYIYVDWTPPSINLNSPIEGQNYTTRTVVLNYTLTDNLATNLYCNVTLDGSIVASQTVGNGNFSTYTANNLLEGTHYWNVTCRDQALNYNTSVTQSFNVYIVPSIILLSPLHNDWSRNSTNVFLFNVSDETGLQNCSILFYGVVNETKTNAQLINNATNNFTLTDMQSGIYNWSIECYDNTTYNAYNITGNRTFNVDTILPEPYIETANNTWFNVGNPSITFNITDNMDLSIDYNFYVNGTPNVTGTVGNGSSVSINLNSIPNGIYDIVLEGVDTAGNRKNSTPITIYIDSVRPTISLTNPLNDTNVTVSTVELNFTPTDNMVSVLICNVTLDGSTVASNLSVNNGANQNVTVSGLLGGYHYWNVTCMDIASNRNTSETYRFYLVMPDLYINPSEIFFSNNNPTENESINITATIRNVGLADAQNFTVQIRVNSMAGTIIHSENISLAMGDSLNIIANYNLVIGDTRFYILVDTPLATNGTIRESNESNNNASSSMHVGLWEYVAGTTNDRLVMSDITNQTIYDWLVSNASGSKIFAVDIDSNINWRNLQALGINMSNLSSNTDFSTLDNVLGSTNFSDSVNRTYTSIGSPLELSNYTIFTKRVDNVPIVNSTNNSNFKTGILWDYGDGGTRYNGTQDVLFVSPINKNTQGYNATVDYELRVPATLRSYKAGQDLVVFYAEIN